MRRDRWMGKITSGKHLAPWTLAALTTLHAAAAIRADTWTVNLDAQDNCILLDDVSPMVTGLVTGQRYTVSVSCTTIHAPMRGAILMYQEAAGVTFRYATCGSSFSFVPSVPQLAPLYVDWSTTSDNSGTITIDVSGPTHHQIQLDARSDCVLLDHVTPIVRGLTVGQTYHARVSSSNVEAPMQGAFFMYQEADGMKFRYTHDGGSFTFVPVYGQIAPFYFDWSRKTDNSGTVTVTIESQGGVPAPAPDPGPHVPPQSPSQVPPSSLPYVPPQLPSIAPTCFIPAALAVVAFGFSARALTRKRGHRSHGQRQSRWTRP